MMTNGMQTVSLSRTFEHHDFGVGSEAKSASDPSPPAPKAPDGGGGGAPPPPAAPPLLPPGHQPYGRQVVEPEEPNAGTSVATNITSSIIGSIFLIS